VSAPRRRPGATPPSRRVLTHEVRIIGGAWKRSKLPVADRPGLRPTPDRVRETLFNWLGQTLAGWRCLDAFAGTGALGFEAASRGAAEVVLLERDAVACASLVETKARLQADAVRVERADALSWMARSAPGAFDLVLLDPPFDAPLAAASAMAAASRIVAAGGFVYVEAPRPVDAATAGTAGLQAWRAARAGAVHFHLFRRVAAG
jgi:16S rRNA (guanine966-N2)-methyltransferase